MKNYKRGGEYKLKNNEKDKKLSEKQKRFCEEYIIDGNATQSAIRAGYSVKTAKVIGSRQLTKVAVKAYIAELQEEIRNNNIADATEVMEHLTKVLRGESKSEVVMVVGDGEGCSHIESIKKTPDEKERLKAAELLGKRFSLFTDKHEVKVALPVVIGGEDDLEE